MVKLKQYLVDLHNSQLDTPIRRLTAEEVDVLTDKPKVPLNNVIYVEAFAKVHKERFLWCTDRKGHLYYKKSVWAADNNGDKAEKAVGTFNKTLLKKLETNKTIADEDLMLIRHYVRKFSNEAL